MAHSTDGLATELNHVHALLTQLQYSRIEAQELTDDELRRLVSEFLTEAIRSLRTRQEEVRHLLLRSSLEKNTGPEQRDTLTAPISAAASA